MVTPIANIRIMFNMRIFKAVRIYYLKDKFITDSLSCPYLIIHHFASANAAILTLKLRIVCLKAANFQLRRLTN